MRAVHPGPVSGPHRARGAASLTRALLCSTALAFAATLAPLQTAPTAHAQTLQQADPNAQLLLTADELIYDNDAQMVTASGNVQLEYDGYNVVADRVTYNRATRRVQATGNVEIIEPDGNKIFAQQIDLTDDFSDGFVNALRVETPDNTRFAAESAERFEGDRTVFNNGVYTACEPCADNPEKAPIWQVKARRVIVDGQSKTISYQDARFEFFGLPIAYFPFFKHADPSVKRKTGFLLPGAGYSSELGAWYRQPYFIETGDTHDLTVSVTGYTNQGVLGDLRWRHQLENGFYTLRAAGIRQNDRNAFDNRPDNDVEERGMIASRGKFDINPRWAFGWDVLAQSDRNFSRTYKLPDYTALNINNEVYLRGLNDRSYFSLSAHQYLIQEDIIVGPAQAFQDEDQQALVRPLWDYNYVRTGDLTGSELSLDVNLTSLERREINQVIPASLDTRTHGIEGDTTRLSADLQWKRQITGYSGLVVTPSFSIRGDAISTNGDVNTPVIVDQGGETRFMPTAGLQVSYPVLGRTESTSHVFEPIAQLLLRPDLEFDGVVPNEDSQSLVFDATSLFDRDKFSGYDRIESGTRLNLGFRYSGTLANGLGINALFGQSYHLSGDNPYAREDDLVNAGEESGLETDTSDFVAAFGAALPSGFSLSTQTRFDEDHYALRRAELKTSFSDSRFSGTVNYTFIDEQPDYGFPDDRRQAGFTASMNFHENWTAFGGAQFDMDTSTIISDYVGLSYHDECFTLSLTFSESRTEDSDVNRSFGFRIGLRTIGDFASSVSATQLVDLAQTDRESEF